MASVSETRVVIMNAVAQRIVWIIGLICLLFGVMGLVAFSPVTIALSVTGWFLARASIHTLAGQSDIQAPTPDLQYWARGVLLRTFGLMVLGALIAAGFITSGVAFHFSVHEQVLLTVLMIAAMVVVSRLCLPGFFAASWEIQGAKERRRRNRTSMTVSRFIIRTVGAMLVVTSLVASFSLMQSIRLGAPAYDKLALMARVVSSDAPKAVAQIFSPSETSTR